MISPELLRRYPFFGALNEAQQKEIAQISEEESFEKGTTFFEEGQPANYLFLLLEGSVDLLYKSEEAYHPKTRKEFNVGEINPGEVFAISALIEPYVYSTAAKAARDGRLVKIDAKALHLLFDQDPRLECSLVHKAAKAAMERLATARVLLAAAWA